MALGGALGRLTRMGADIEFAAATSVVDCDDRPFPGTLHRGLALLDDVRRGTAIDSTSPRGL